MADGTLLQPSKPLTPMEVLLDVTLDNSANTFPNSSIDTRCCTSQQREGYYAGGGGAVPGGSECGWTLCAPWGLTVLQTFSSAALPGPPATAHDRLPWAWYFVAHSLATTAFPVQAADFWPPIKREYVAISPLQLIHREWHRAPCVDGADAATCTDRLLLANVNSNHTLLTVGNASHAVFAPSLVTVVPLLGGFAFLGEAQKYVGLSPLRFSSIRLISTATLQVIVHGSPEEVVVLTCLVPRGSDSAATVSQKTLTFPKAGRRLSQHLSLTVEFEAAENLRGIASPRLKSDDLAGQMSFRSQLFVACTAPVCSDPQARRCAAEVKKIVFNTRSPAFSRLLR